MANKKVSQLTSKPSVLVTDLFPIADPSTGQLYKTTISDLGTAIGSGVSSVNGLVGAVVLDTDDIQELVSPTNKWFTDTRARAALSASSPLAYNSGTGVFSIPAATSSQNGYLTSTDWTTFNSKQAALSGTGFVKISGTTISYDNSSYLTTSAAASTYLALSGGTLTGALNGTSATFTGDLTISSGNPRIYLTDTDNNPDYFISNTDGTFTVYDVTNSTSRFTIGTTGNGTFGGNLTVGSIIKSGGTSSQFLKADGSIDSTAYLPLAGGTLTGALFGASASFSGFVGFGGNTSPLAAIDVTGAGIFSSSVTATRLILSGGTSPTGLYFGHTDKVVLANYTTGGGIDFETNGGNITMQLSSAGNLSTTGSISGTSATFSGLITSNVTQSNTIGSGTNFSSPSGYWTIRTGVSNDFNIDTFNGGVPVNAFKIAQSGAATFSSSVTTGGTISATNADIYSQNGTGSNLSIGFKQSDAVKFRLRYDISGDTVSMVGSSGNFIQTWNQSGNVGIGTTAPLNATGYTSISLNNATNGGILDYQQNGTSVMRVGNNGTTVAFIETRTATPLTISTNDTERMRITSGGKLIVGATSDGNTGLVQIHGTARAVQLVASQGGITAGNYAIYGHDDDNGYINVVRSVYTGDFHFRFDGTTRATINRSTGVYVATSDINKKKDIEESKIGLSEVMQLKPTLYRMKVDSNESEKQLGFIAQDVKGIIPGAYHESGDFIGLNFNPIVAALTKAIQELKAELDTLKNK